MLTGQLLSGWFDESKNERLVDACGRGIARNVRAEMLDEAVDKTPLGTFDPETSAQWYEPGAAKRSWRVKPVQRGVSARGGVRERTWTTGVESHLEYVRYLDEGWGLWGPRHSRYIIRPRKPGGALRFRGKSGEIMFRAFVMHPGAAGFHMTSWAAAMAEHRMAGLSRLPMERFARALERGNTARYVVKGDVVTKVAP